MSNNQNTTGPAADLHVSDAVIGFANGLTLSVGIWALMATAWLLFA